MKTFKTIQLTTVIIGMIYGVTLADKVNASSSESTAGLIIVIITSVLALTIATTKHKGEWEQ